MRNHPGQHLRARPVVQVARRLLDLALVSCGLILLGPLFLLIALGIRLSSPGPIFYRARRVGYGGNLFDLYKFRSMFAQADREGPGITIARDARITPFGRTLRRTKLDELPQLWNVLKGDMSLVGPRPEDPRYVAYYTPSQRQLLQIRPGITSPASLHYRDEAKRLTETDWERLYLQEILPHKLELELAYAERRTLLSDLYILARTARALF